ncbi:MAG: PaaX domain-containing protein, C- domain protein [Acidimicrobiales bacterium]|nr:PaaX domain-containing protein, C- domain protein [Acidimicrobiales bacterium]
MSNLRKFSARSVILSVLLGAEPPKLPVQLLVRTTELFGISEGTTRTALSRMTSAGEISSEDGWYELSAERHLIRQRLQIEGRHGPTKEWLNDFWIQAVVTADRRSATDRAELRAKMSGLHMGELREGVWIRPDNLEFGNLLEHLHLTWFKVLPLDSPVDLVSKMWNLKGWDDKAASLIVRLLNQLPKLNAEDKLSMRNGFELSAEVLRHLKSDPLLPQALLPNSWRGDVLRSTYDSFDRAFRELLVHWFGFAGGI